MHLRDTARGHDRLGEQREHGFQQTSGTRSPVMSTVMMTKTMRMMVVVMMVMMLCRHGDRRVDI